MERKSFAWVWAGVGVVAVLILVTSGVWRQSTPSLNAPPNATPPIIVEPIQPTAAAQLPALSADPTADAAAGPRGQGAEESPSANWPRETPRPPAGVSADAVTALPSDGPTRVKTIQQALQAAGYSPGAVDGRMGRQTQKAIREFQEAHGLGVDGKVGPRTWAKLGAYLQNPETSAAPSSTE